MHKLIGAIAVALMMIPAAASQASASDKTDVLATIHQFATSDMNTALAACAAPASIIDEFPPHEWQGATACADWANDFETYSKNNGITEPVMTLGKPKHVDITGDRAYVVVPATYTYKKNGKQVTESGSILTVALHKVAAGWRITGWAWTKH